MTRLASIVMPAVLCALLAGCVERRIWIDSEPPGALVWINHAQVGRTPVDVAFTHEGTYDVRIEKDGYEPLVTPATTEGPLWDAVPFDLVVEILPVKARNETRWKFTLVARDDSETALVERAAGLRDRLRAAPASDTEGEDASEKDVGADVGDAAASEP
jgi:hypothetical protein